MLALLALDVYFLRGEVHQIVCKKSANALLTSSVAIVERGESRTPRRETRGEEPLYLPCMRFRASGSVCEKPGAPAALLISQNLKDVGCCPTGRARSCLGCFGRMSDA